MPYEEDMIALLEQGRVESVANEEVRQARYKSEDVARVNLRAREDELAKEGDNVREAKIAEMNEAIKARGLPVNEQLAQQQAMIEKLTVLVERASTAPVESGGTVVALAVHPDDPHIPVV